jgi:hypothetical protein
MLSSRTLYSGCTPILSLGTYMGLPSFVISMVASMGG